MSTTITAAAIGIVAVSTFATAGQLAASGQRRRNYVWTLRAVRWWMLPTALANLTVVLLALFGITSLAPWSWVGWWELLGGTNSNIWLGQTGRTGLRWQVAAFGIPLSLLFLLPMLAHVEETVFRLGSEKHGIAARLGRQLSFGFMHCAFAGVPLAAGLALTLSGFYFERVYLLAFRRLQPEIEAAQHVPEYVRTPYPERPSGQDYDVAAWRRHMEEVEAVAELNQRRIDEWARERRVRAGAAEALVERVVAKAAAAHAVSNAVVIGVLLIFLMLAHHPS